MFPRAMTERKGTEKKNIDGTHTMAHDAERWRYAKWAIRLIIVVIIVIIDGRRRCHFRCFLSRASNFFFSFGFVSFIIDAPMTEFLTLLSVFVHFGRWEWKRVQRTLSSVDRRNNYGLKYETNCHNNNNNNGGNSLNVYTFFRPSFMLGRCGHHRNFCAIFCMCFFSFNFVYGSVAWQRTPIILSFAHFHFFWYIFCFHFCLLGTFCSSFVSKKRRKYTKMCWLLTAAEEKTKKTF